MTSSVLSNHMTFNTLRADRTEWVNLVSPSNSELSKVLKAINLPTDTLQSMRGNLQKLEDNTVLLKLQIPRKNLPRSKVPYQVTMLTILVKEGVVITISEDESFLFTHLEHEHLVNWAEKNSTDFLFRILSMTTENFLQITNSLSDKIAEIELKLKRAFHNRSVFELLNLNKSLLYFSKALNRNIRLLKNLSRRSVLRADHEQDLALIDLIAKAEQVESLARTYHANLRNLMDAYSAVIENNLSLSVQYLTIFVTVITIPMAIGGIYGMNTPLPLQDEHYALTALGIIGVIVIASLLTFFKSKKLI